MAATPRADCVLPAGNEAPGTRGRNTVGGGLVAFAKGRRQVELPARLDEPFTIGAEGAARRGGRDHLSQSAAECRRVLAGQRGAPDGLEAFFGLERHGALKALLMLATAAPPADEVQAGENAAEGGGLLAGRAILAGVEVDPHGTVTAQAIRQRWTLPHAAGARLLDRVEDRMLAAGLQHANREARAGHAVAVRRIASLARCSRRRPLCACRAHVHEPDEARGNPRKDLALNRLVGQVMPATGLQLQWRCAPETGFQERANQARAAREKLQGEPVPHAPRARRQELPDRLHVLQMPGKSRCIASRRASGSGALISSRSSRPARSTGSSAVELEELEVRGEAGAGSGRLSSLRIMLVWGEASSTRTASSSMPRSTGLGARIGGAAELRLNLEGHARAAAGGLCAPRPA